MLKIYFKLKASKYYGLYKQNNTGTKRGLVLGQNQYTRGGTDKTSKTIGQGVAKLYSYIFIY